MSIQLAITAGCTTAPKGPDARDAAAPADLPVATRSEVYAMRGIAATSHPLATQIAVETMQRGGSAIDAAIAANAALGLMEPTGCGIGGDLFAIVWDPATKQLYGYNGSGRSSGSITLDGMRSRIAELVTPSEPGAALAIPSQGPLPVTVPGCVDGWFALHGRFGELSMREVLAPAIRYATDGFPVTPEIASGWQRNVEILAKWPSVREQFTVDGSGRTPTAGEVWRNPQLATTLQRIAAEGRGAFYEGDVPRVIERFLASQGGVLTAADFATHAGEWVQPVTANYRGYDVWELPPNGQGIAALQILQLLEGFDLKAMGWGSADHVHAFVEAKKLAFADRAMLYADPAFDALPVRELISDAYADARRQLIDMRRAALSTAAGSPPTGADTIYLTTADASGMMVSLIQSNYRGMGSGMVPTRVNADGSLATGPDATLGFMLQNRGEQFALVEGHPNVIAPRKRPFHTIIPAFITKDGEPWMSFGVMGGAMQPQGHVQIVINLIDFGMTLQQAGDAPRIHHDGSTEPAGMLTPMRDGGVLNLEPGFPEATLAELSRRGHLLKPARTPVFGGYQAIRRLPTGVYEGASESRKDGHAAGY